MNDNLSVRVGAENVFDQYPDEATYQAAMTPITLFQDVYEHRPDQHEELADLYGEDVVERATNVG